MAKQSVIKDKRFKACGCGGEVLVIRSSSNPDLGRACCSKCGITTLYKPIKSQTGKIKLDILIQNWNAKDYRKAEALHESSENPLFEKIRFTCCGYTFKQPLCVRGYEPIDFDFCPKCGTGIR